MPKGKAAGGGYGKSGKKRPAFIRGVAVRSGLRDCEEIFEQVKCLRLSL